ncbi:hypothetical protein LJC19_07985 [Oxalobacter sp. OttesenSCG-928-P03]|nr:hypothetical protein [Oxalobacter sp. OttesenSCG-928-P03]
MEKMMSNPNVKAEVEDLERDWDAMTREGIADAEAGNRISTEEMLAFVDSLSEGHAGGK